MSYTELIKVPERGEAEIVAEFQNAWLGAAHIWCKLSGFYLGNEGIWLMGKEQQALWDLAGDENVPLDWRVTLATTFDKVMVKREDLLRVAEAFKNFSNAFEPGSLLQQGKVLEQLANDPTCYAVCWNQTSVNGDIWRVADEDREEGLRMYDLSKDEGHWFLFDRIPKSGAADVPN